MMGAAAAFLYPTGGKVGIVYYSFVFLYAVQRLLELEQSDRNVKELSKQGFTEQEPPLRFRLLVLVHVLWFLGLVAEPLYLPRSVPHALAMASLLLFLAAQLLRLWVVHTLGVHWNVRVMRPAETPDRPSFSALGPYRYLRHPNYLAVIIEVATLPLVNGAYLTAIIGTVLNGIVLFYRIRLEERALFRDPAYGAIMGPKARFIPYVI